MQIITLAGRDLDLDTTGTINIEYQSPLFESDHLPVPFTTSIPFLKTPTNCKEFQLLPALMAEPKNKRIPAKLYLNGFCLMSGVLTYDSQDSDVVNYIFSENFELSKMDDTDISEIDLPMNFPTNSAGFMYWYMLPYLKFPPMINKAKVSYEYNKNKELDIARARYCNFPNISQGDLQIGRLTPCVQLYELLIRAFPHNTLEMQPWLEEQLKKIFIICPYAPNGANGIGVASTFDGLNFDNSLPKLSVAELCLNIAGIFSAAYYVDGEKIKLISAEDVICDDWDRPREIIDWSEKIIGLWSSRVEEAQNYEISFIDDSSDNTYDSSLLVKDRNDGNIIEVDSYKKVIDAASNLPGEEYTAVRHKGTGDIFSVKFMDYAEIPGQGHRQEELVSADSLLRHSGPSEDIAGTSTGTLKRDISFKLCRPVPDTYILTRQRIVAPIVSLPTIGEERGTMAIIGVISDDQMSDKGVVCVPDDRWNTEPKPVKDKYVGFSLAPNELINQYARFYSRWLALDRQVVSVHLNLTAADLSAFRMYNKVYFAGRDWVPISLSCSVDIGTGNIECDGEFIQGF